MTVKKRFLITGAAGRAAGVGRQIAAGLLKRGEKVRAVVRRLDARSASLEALGAEVMVADLRRPDQIIPVLRGCERLYFGLGIGPGYLEASLAFAAAARATAGIEVILNMSQMTVSEMSVDAMTESPQQRHHWLAEQAFDWSGLPVTHLRPTVFLDGFFLQLSAPAVRRDDTLRLPFGRGRTSPVASSDVAEVACAVLSNPEPHIGSALELTGPEVMDMTGVAASFSRALGRRIAYQDISHDDWRDEMQKLPFNDHLADHLDAMARLHRDNRYDRTSDTVERILGRSAMAVEEFVRMNASVYSSYSSGRIGAAE